MPHDMPSLKGTLSGCYEQPRQRKQKAWTLREQRHKPGGRPIRIHQTLSQAAAVSGGVQPTEPRVTYHITLSFLAGCVVCCLITKSCPTLKPDGLKYARLPCPPLSPRACSSSSGLYQCVLGRGLHCLHNPHIYIYILFIISEKCIFVSLFICIITSSHFRCFCSNFSGIFLSWTWILIPEVCANWGCHVDDRNEAKPRNNYKSVAQWYRMVIHSGIRMLAHPPSRAASPSGSNHSTLLSLHLLWALPYRACFLHNFPSPISISTPTPGLAPDCPQNLWNHYFFPPTFLTFKALALPTSQIGIKWKSWLCFHFTILYICFLGDHINSLSHMFIFILLSPKFVYWWSNLFLGC